MVNPLLLRSAVEPADGGLMDNPRLGFRLAGFGGSMKAGEVGADGEEEELLSTLVNTLGGAGGAGGTRARMMGAVFRVRFLLFRALFPAEPGDSARSSKATFNVGVGGIALSEDKKTRFTPSFGLVSKVAALGDSGDVLGEDPHTDAISFVVVGDEVEDRPSKR